MKAQLTTDQIDQLFAFVNERGVKYIDVQHEVVDHLASAVEEEMALNRTWSFEQALNIVYGRFPITGFTQFIQEQEKALASYWRLRTWEHFTSYFTWPKMLLTIAVFLSTWSIFQLGNYWINGTFCTLVFYAFSVVSSKIIVSEKSNLKLLPSIFVYGGCWVSLCFSSWQLTFGGQGVMILGFILQILMYGKNYVAVLSEKYLVIKSFMQVIVGTVVVLVFIPQYGGFDGRLPYLAVDNALVANILALVLSVAIVITHAFSTSIIPMLREDIVRKYPHLKIA